MQVKQIIRNKSICL
ncbi:hypothetical protein BDFB_002364 [Asbolus verrucosus]|uniref:Uncharacterized protein n=1 Tax=Asbolus verrucosus TaxID=1661398 RepID=A0A482V0Q0_ASBVE|nr:hypothetical protein BDFB_002364 [Asbolus verrucosus]